MGHFASKGECTLQPQEKPVPKGGPAYFCMLFAK